MVINENITSTSINTTLLNAFKAFDHYCKARLRLSMVVGVFAYKWSDHTKHKFSLLNHEKSLQAQPAFYPYLKLQRA